MQLISQIKKDMEFNRNLSNLISVLKQISLSQYHILERKVKSFQRIFQTLGDLFTMIDIKGAQHPLLSTGNRQAGIIAVTTDTGLLGGLNLQVIELAIKEVTDSRARLIIIGEKGRNYANESGIPFTVFAGIRDEDRLKQALELRDYVMQEEMALRLGALKIIYPFPVSIVSQKVRVLPLLPFAQFEAGQPRPEETIPEDIVLESQTGDIAGYLVYLLLGHKFHEIFGLSRLAELSARFVHLEDSEGKIDQLNKQLRLQYYRQRHEMIDRSMRELFAARLAFG